MYVRSSVPTFKSAVEHPAELPGFPPRLALACGARSGRRVSFQELKSGSRVRWLQANSTDAGQGIHVFMFAHLANCTASVFVRQRLLVVLVHI